MKKIYLVLLTASLFLTNHYSSAQSADKSIPITISDFLDITYSKTTSIVFPYAIHSVDKGSQDVLVQKAKGLENVLQVKAARQHFEETNLTVITSDGKLYNFTLCYADNPTKLTYTYSEARKGNFLTYSESNDNQQRLVYGAELAYHERKKVNYKKTDNGITLAVTGLFIHNDLIHYRIKIVNDTHISYDIDQLRFFIRDQKKAKRTASQEIEILPVWIYKAIEKVGAKGVAQFVCVLPKFTIPDDKNLIVELIERSGGRHLLLELKNSKTNKVFPIPAFTN